MSENWKTDGNCKECRKKSYCKKLCTLAKRSQDAFIQSAISKIIPKL